MGWGEEGGEGGGGGEGVEVQTCTCTLYALVYFIEHNTTTWQHHSESQANFTVKCTKVAHTEATIINAYSTTHVLKSIQ